MSRVPPAHPGTMVPTRVILPVLLLALAASTSPEAATAQSTLPDSSLRALTFRELGPFRGGRVTAVDGIPDRPHTFFFGSTGGGVWKTESAGQGWENLTDGWLDVGSIGAVEVADADPNVVWVGTGSADLRGNVSTGRGVWSSDDGGATWRFVGLEDAGQVARIRTHPSDPDIAWLAATGHPFGPNEQRGVFRTMDGGESWEKVLFLSDSVGAVDLALHPENPRILYAAMWRGERKPWTMISGAREGGVYRSKDGGDRWEKLAGGLPRGLVGMIGLAVSPARPDRVWAMVEAPEPRAGLYRSDDGGESWELVNTNPRIRTRPWYYNHVTADPRDPNTVWVLNSGLFRSVDGGGSFDRIPMPHGDHHAMWINPLFPEIIMEGNDGGANVSLDGGQHWSTQLNQPTAEMYNVAVDDRFPYRVYGSQQDNSTISLPSAATGSGVTLQHWRGVGGCETGPVAVRPDDPDIVYSGCFGGRFARADATTEQFRQIRPYPQAQDAMPERELRYRVQWNFPVEISPHDPGVLYYGSQVVHRTTNEGQSWEVLSPDLTRNDTTRFGMAGGPITHDVTGVEMWSALLAIQESPHTPGVIWTGSNDGRVHVTRDGGGSWSDVTPPDLPVPSTVNRIHLSSHRPGKAYLAVYRYRMDDWRPYLYRTEDWGRSWERIADGTRGIPADHPTRVVMEDPEREGLLFAGTEFGPFLSLDDGASWRPLQQNLPPTPVADLAIQERRGDLVVATQGRGFWILDDLTLLRGWDPEALDAPVRLFPPRDAYRAGWRQEEGHYERDRVYGAMLPRGMKGTNPPEGAVVYYHLGADAEEVTLEILEEGGVPVRRFSNLPGTRGSHRFVWDLHYPGPDPGVGSGPRAVPGDYRVRVTADGAAEEASFTVLKDPRLTDVTLADLRAQFDYLSRAQARMAELNRGINTLREVREAVTGTLDRLEDAREGAEWLSLARERADTIVGRLDGLEDELVQTEGTGWDREAKLRRQLSWAIQAARSQRGVYIDARPTDQLVERLGDIELELSGLLDELERVLEEDVGELNAFLRERGVGPVLIS